MRATADDNPMVQVLVDTIDRRIRDGQWPVGYRIPPERELTTEFNLSRNTLRRGLKLLEDEGKIVRYVGRGSFVASAPFDDPNPNLSSLVEFAREASPVEIMEVRFMIEPQAAALAAIRASAEDLRQLQSHLAAGAAASGLDEFEYNDGLLHQGIVRAAKNSLLEAIYTAINLARIQPEWRTLKQRSLTIDQRATYHRHHAAIISALVDRNADHARQLATEHLIKAREDLLGQAS